MTIARPLGGRFLLLVMTIRAGGTMPAERVSMRRVREILRLKHDGATDRDDGLDRRVPIAGGVERGLHCPEALSIAGISADVKSTPPLPGAALAAQLKCHLPFQTTSYPGFSLSSEAMFGWRA